MKVKETYLVCYYGRSCELYLTETDKWILNKPIGNGVGHYNVMTEITVKEAKKYIKQGLL